MSKNTQEKIDRLFAELRLLEADLAANKDTDGLNSLITQLVGTAFFAQKDYNSIIKNND